MEFKISNGISRELTWIVVSLWLFLLFAWLTDAWIESIVAYTLFYIGRHLWSMVKFERWLRGGTQKSFPPSSGLWGELSYLVSKKQLALEKHADLINYKSEQFRAASMNLPTAILSLTNSHQIEWFNESAQQILAIRHSDVGRKIETLLRAPDFIRYLKSQHYQQPIFLDALTKQKRVFTCQIFNYYHEHKLVVFEDVTDLYNLAQIRRDFVANASHELRTPLTVVSGYLEMMLDMLSPETQIWQKPLSQMHHQAKRMQSIIEDLLTLSSIESDVLLKEPELVAASDILLSMARDNQALYGERYQMIFEIEAGLNIKGYIEPLKSVFSNLISNAIRYTPEGGKITVRWYHKSDGAHFEVEDTGIGILKEHIPRLTERFYRVDTARSRDTGGTGLGLAIVKHALEKHASHLEVTSQLGKGSIFSCVFQIEKVLKGRSNKHFSEK